LVAGLMACLFVIASPLLAQQAPVLVTQTVNNSVRTVLPNNVHPLARPEFDQGEAPADLVLHRLMLVLKRSDQQETTLRRLIENQQYKKSPSYHQWLTPVEFGAQFGPADSDIAAVTNWLQASGFQVSQVSNGRTVIEFSGTAGQVKQAFGTAIHRYLVNGEQHLANVSNPSIPTALAPVVAGVNSLHSFLKKPANIRVGTYSEKTKQLTSAQPSFNVGCGSGLTCYAVSPFDFANIYDVLPLWNAAITGTGQTIAIVARTDINPDDATTFWSLFGLGANGVPMPTLKRIYNGPNPFIIDADDEAEADIDTQWSGAVAPGATIDLVVSESTETDDGVDLSALYIVDNNLAPIMSESFSECEANLGASLNNFYAVLWEQASAQGISAMVSSGDSGSAGCDPQSLDYAAQNGLGVNGLASTPFNVAVGGTDFNQYNNWTPKYWSSSNNPTTQESAVGYIPETSWNDSCTYTAFLLNLDEGFTSNPEINCNNSSITGLGGLVDTLGGGGGPSNCATQSGKVCTGGYAKPEWQTGTGVPNDNVRDTPDVSLFASDGYLEHSFYVICQSDQTGGAGCNLENLEAFGGTSIASPAFAGIMALVNQEMGLTVPNYAAGNPNFVLYDLVSTVPSAFHDIGGPTLPPQTTNSMPCVAGSNPNCVSISGDNYGVLMTTPTSGILAWNTGTGYDLATGLGSVDAKILVDNWGSVNFAPTKTTLALTIPGNTTTHGTGIPVKVTAAPISGVGTPTGDVALLVSPGTSGATPPNPGIDWNSLGAPSPSGTASWKTYMLPGGTYQVVAHYEGDTTYGGSYSGASTKITVNPENSSVYMGTPPGLLVGVGTYGNSVVYGTGAFDLYLLRADVYNQQGNQCSTASYINPITNLSIACPTGTIGFTDSVNGGNPNPLDASPYTLNSFGYTEDQAIQLTGGTHTLVASYSGDNSYNKSSTTATVTVTKATTAIAPVAISPNPVNTGQQFTVTATGTTPSYGLFPTGTVSFFYGTTLLGTAQTTGTNGSFSAVTRTGTPASFAASLTTSIPTAGTYNITASYSGDGNYSSTTSAAVQIVVNPSTTPGYSLSAAPSSLTIAAGGAGGTSTISVTDVGGFTGNVSLVASGLPSGVTAVFNPTSTATTSVLTLTASGSAALGGPTPVTITGTSGALIATTTVLLTIAQDFTVPATLTNPPAANPGQSTSTTMLISPVGGTTFASNVTYTCTAGLPTGISSCLFNQASPITAGSSATTVTVTIQTLGPFAGALGGTLQNNERPRMRSQNQRLWLPLSLPLAGMLLVGLAGRRLPRSYKIVGLCLALAVTGFLVACGGGSSSPPPPAIGVTVSPSTVNTLYPNLTGAPAQSVNLTATVNNSTNQAVTWAITANGTTDTVTSTGTSTATYTAPTAVPAGPVTVTATSQAGSKTGNSIITILTPTAANTYPITVTVAEGAIQHTATFSLKVN